jgi:hypothetical protein
MYDKIKAIKLFNILHCIQYLNSLKFKWHIQYVSSLNVEWEILVGDYG